MSIACPLVHREDITSEDDRHDILRQVGLVYRPQSPPERHQSRPWIHPSPPPNNSPVARWIGITYLLNAPPHHGILLRLTQRNSFLGVVDEFVLYVPGGRSDLTAALYLCQLAGSCNPLREFLELYPQRTSTWPRFEMQTLLQVDHRNFFCVQ